VLATQLYKLLFALTKWDISTTLLHFPRFVHEPAYLYARLRPVLPQVRYEDFLAAFRQVAQPQLVHQFSADDAYATSAKD